MAARISKSLDTLRSQVNALAPGRSKASDGWLGDAKHSMRKSDHNAEPDGTVDAFDLTHDPKNGVDIQRVCDAIVASRDRRVSYLICNGKIIAGSNGPKPWTKRAYNGPNKHTKHLHISVLDAHQDDTTPWDIGAAFGGAAPGRAPVPATRSRPAPAGAPEAPQGHFPAKGTIDDPLVEKVQRQLRDLGYSEAGNPDGDFGDLTENAILIFRKDAGLPLSPAIDDALLAALAKAGPRTLSTKRTEASPKDVRAAVPEVRANWFGQVWSAVAAGLGIAGGMLKWLWESVGEVRDGLQPVLDVLGDVPWWLYTALFVAAAVFAWNRMRQGEAAGVAAWQAGERR